MSTSEELLQINPFPGLRAFEPPEASQFFGRRQQIDELVQRLEHVQLLVVAGESGCGKSSLVLAGLLNELARPEVAGDIEWRSVVMRPGNSPIAELASKLAELYPGGASKDGRRAASLGGRLRLGGLGLIEAVRVARLRESVRVMVVVDQFEELFRFAKDTGPDESAAFVKLLLNAAGDPLAPVSVVLTMRTDALGACATFRDLPEAINQGLYLVPRLTREQRTEAIVGPVESRGERIAQSLVQRILNDVSNAPDDLPVMQHALNRTWQKWALSGGNRKIDLNDYEAAGGAEHALSNHADEAYDSLSELKPLVQRVFRALTERTVEGDTNRRPFPFARLCCVVGAPPDQVAKVIERFRRTDTAFVMPRPDEPLSPGRMIDISHESLIRLWARLKDWVEIETKARTGMERLLMDAEAWEKQNGDLLGPHDLEGVDEWLEPTQPNACWVGLGKKSDGVTEWDRAQRYLHDSREAVKKRANDRRRRRCWIIAAALVFVLILFGWIAREDRLKTKAQAANLASQALLERDEDPALSAHLALAALDKDPDNANADYALRNAVEQADAAYARKIIPLGEPLVDVSYSKDRATLVVAGEKQVYLLNAANFEKGRPIPIDGYILRAWLMAGDHWLLVHLGDALILQPRDGSTHQPLECPGEDKLVVSVAVSADLDKFALGCRDGQIVQWGLGSDGPHQSAEWSLPEDSKNPITALAFSHDGASLASGDIAGVVRIWMPSNSKPIKVIERKDQEELNSTDGHSKAVTDIAFHPNRSQFLVAGYDDGQAIAWELALPNMAVTNDRVLKHKRPVKMVRFTPHDDGNGVLTVSGTDVRLWENERSTDPRGLNDWVMDARVSDSGDYIAAASSDGTARVWSSTDPSPVARLRGHRGAVTRAIFLPDSDSRDVLTTSLDGTVRIWALNPPSNVIGSETRWQLGAAFDPTGHRVVMCGEQSGAKYCSIIDLGSPDARPVELVTEGAGQLQSPTWSGDGSHILGVRAITSAITSEREWNRPVIWNSKTGEDVTPTWLIEKYYFASFGSQLKQFIALGKNGGMEFWGGLALTEKNPEPKISWNPQSGPYRWWVTLSPDGKWIAAIQGKVVQLWHVKDPKLEPLLLEGHRGDVRRVRFSSDSRFVVTASEDRTARVWEVAAEGRSSIVLAGGHSSALSSAAFSPDGNLVVTSGADRTIRLWNAKSGNPVITLRVHRGTVNDVQFSPDGKSILSASDDGTVRLTRCNACGMNVEQLRSRVRQVPLSVDDRNRLRDMVEGPVDGW